MRKNKYRAYQKNAKWMLPVLSINWGADGEIESITVDNTNNNTRNVSPRSQTFYKNDPIYSLDVLILMEFTGLTDKNGKEIYEGDIMKFQKYSNYNDEHSNLKRHIAKVIFKEGCFCWYILKEGSQSDFHYSYKTEPLKNTCTTWGLEIIGSIHDTPELLTK